MRSRTRGASLAAGLAASISCSQPPTHTDDDHLTTEPPLAEATDLETDPTPPPADPWAEVGLTPLRSGDRLTWPVENVHVTSNFGWRVDPVEKSGLRLHRGVDFRGETGDLALSIADGTVVFAGRDPFLGNLVIVDHGIGVTSLYGHLADLLVHQGLRLERGAAVGLVGNTGRSAAPHLHLTIKVDDVAVDPLMLLGQPLHRAPALAARRPPPALAPQQ